MMNVSTFMNIYSHGGNSECIDNIISIFVDIFIYQVRNKLIYDEVDIENLVDSLDFNKDTKELAIYVITKFNNNKAPLSIDRFDRLVFDVELQERLYEGKSDITEIIFIYNLLDFIKAGNINSFIELISKFSSKEQFDEIVKNFQENEITFNIPIITKDDLTVPVEMNMLFQNTKESKGIINNEI